MKINVIRKAMVYGLTLILTAMLALPAMAQEDALKAFPGYVDFGDLGNIFGEPTVQISVGASLLSLVGSLSASEDPEAAEMFKRLNGVRVNVYENTEVSAEGLDLVRDVSSQLTSGAVQVYVRGDPYRTGGPNRILGRLKNTTVGISPRPSTIA